MLRIGAWNSIGEMKTLQRNDGVQYTDEIYMFLDIVSAQTCTQLTAPADGMLNITAGSGTDYATVLTFSCDPGYEIIGTVNMYCRTNGSWSDSVPTCQSKCDVHHVYVCTCCIVL